MEDVKWHYHSCETSPEFHGVADIPYAAQNIYIMTTDNVDIPQHEAGIAISPRLALFWEPSSYIFAWSNWNDIIN